MDRDVPLDTRRIEFHGYAPLIEVLNDAAIQAAHGKGHERHAGDKAFVDQPMLAITRRYGLGFPFGQVEKKMEEAHRMVAQGKPDAAVRELLGAINYLAGSILYIHETSPETNE